MSATGTIICKLCLKQKAPYTCPKCQVPYCSLKCYQTPQHEKCSEQFYEANVIEELQQQSASEDEKNAMLALLKQFEEDCADDEETIREGEATAQLAARLQDIDLDGDPQKIWEKLSQQEREDFQKIVKEQNFSDLVQEWLPWWSYKREKKPLVSEVTSDPSETPAEDLSEFNFPEISTSTKPFSALCKAEPSACLKYNTVNILLAYTYMAMRYNGEHHDMSVQCAEDLVSLSQVLLTAENCLTTAEAVRSFCASLKQLDDLFISMEYVMEVIENLLMLIHGPDEQLSNDYILMAYSDIVKLLDGARKELKSDPEGGEGRKKLLLMRRKIEYYCSYALSHAEDDFLLLSTEIILEKGKLTSEMESHKETEKLQKKAKEKDAALKKPKIVEMT